MSRSTFAGPVRSGVETGVSATRTIGTFPAYVETTALTTTQVALMPSQSANIHDLYVKVLANSSGGAGGTAINFGIAGDATFYGTITVSAVGFHRLNATQVSARNLANASGAVLVAAPTASAASNFVAGVGYLQNP